MSVVSAMPADAATAAVDELYRSDWGRIVATLIRLVGDFDLAEEAAQEAFAVAVDSWRTSGVPELPRAWIIKTARHKAIDRIRRRQLFEEKLEWYAHHGVRAERRGAELRHERDSRRSPAADLHVLPPGARARGTGRADAAHARRARDRRDRPRVPRAAGDDGAAAGAREAEDSRGAHSLHGAGHDRHAGAARRRADGDLSHLQRRVRGDPAGAAGQDRSLRRGHPTRASRADAHAATSGRGDGARRAHAAARFAAGRAGRRRGRSRRARRAGSRPLGSEADRGRAAARRRGIARRAGALRAAGGDRGAALPGRQAGGHGLAADRRSFTISSSGSSPLRSCR